MGSISLENQDPEQQDDWSDYKNVVAGDVLRRTREHYGLSIDDVEKHLHIRRSYLEALEEGAYDVLPGRVYALGFVRSYSDFLGLDGNKMIQLFKLQLADKHAKPELHFPISASESKLPNLYVLGSSLAVFVGVIIMFVMFDHKREAVPIPAPQDVLEQVGAVTGVVPFNSHDSASGMDFTQLNAIAPASGVDPSVIQPDKPSRIVIYARDSSWVDITDKTGKSVFAQVLSAGERFDVPDIDGLVMNVGNLGGLSLTLDGRELNPLGNEGQQGRDFALTPSSLEPFLKTVEN